MTDLTTGKVADQQINGRFSAHILYRFDIRGKRVTRGGPGKIVRYEIGTVSALYDWHTENNIFPAVGGSSGMGRKVAYYEPEDAHKLIKWLESNGVKRVQNGGGK